MFVVQIWDIHTSHLIATATDGDDDRLVAAEPLEYAIIIIDLICTTNSTCMSEDNSLFISYYGENWLFKLIGN